MQRAIGGQHPSHTPGRVWQIFAVVAAMVMPPLAYAQTPPAVDEEAAPSAPVSVEGNGVFGSSTWGSRGAYRVMSARPITAGSLTLTISDEYFSTSTVFAHTNPPDTDQQSTQRTRVVWSPIYGLEVGLAQVSTVNKYYNMLPRTFQVQGNPSLLVKYSRTLVPELGVGAYATFLIPTSEFGAGLTPAAFVFTGEALVSYQPIDWVEFSANIGYILDQSKQLFPLGADPQQAFVYEINKLNRLTYGVSAVGDIPIQNTVTLAPFLEVTGQYGSDPNANANPVRATLGLKGYPTHGRAVELGLGFDYRLGGAPETGSLYAGIPPWTAFGQLTIHLGESLDKSGTVVVTQNSGQSCQADSDCAQNQACQSNVCTLVVYKEKEVFKDKEVVKEQPTFNLTGGVFDASTGEPISYATITVSGFDSQLSVDPKTGAFTVWPLATGSGLVQLKVKAPGYLDADQTIPRGTAAGDNKQVVFKLKSDNKPQFGTLKGNLKDARTGQPLAGARVFIPVLGQRLVSGPDGGFEAQIKVGRYQVLFNAKKYITQKKELNIKNGDVVIMNVDLRPKKRPGR